MQENNVVQGRALNSEASDDIDLLALFGTVWRGKWWVVLAGALGLVLAAYYAFMVTVPLYKSTVTLALEQTDQSFLDLESVVSGVSSDETSINTQIEVMRSRNLIGRMVDELDLTSTPAYNQDLRPYTPTFRDRAADFLPFITPLPREPLDAETLRERAVDTILEQIVIVNQRNSLVFRITATTESQQLSARLANGLADNYTVDQVESAIQATIQATEWVGRRVDDLTAELASAQQRLRDFVGSNQIVTPEEVSALNRQIVETRERLSQSQEQLDQAKVMASQGQAADERIAAIRQFVADEDWVQLANLTEDQALRAILARLDDADRADALMARAAELVVVLENPNDEFGMSVGRLEAQVSALTAALASSEIKFTSLSKTLVTLQGYEREVQQTQTLTEYFQTRLREIIVQQGIQQAEARVLSKALVPLLPASPNKKRILAGGLFAGAALAMMVILGREATSNGIRSAEDLEKLSGLIVMGQLPKIKTRSRMEFLEYLTDKPTSRLAESFRSLRTSLMLSNLDRTPQVLLSTSSVPGEGKTTQSFALAQSFGAMGKRTLLIEADIRRRIFSERLGFSDDFGLLAVLSDAAELNDVLQKDTIHIPGVDVLVGDRGKANPVDVFSSQRFATFLKEMREIYDVVIIDAPPVLAVPDARVIAQEVDAVLYTVKWDSTPRTAVREGLRLLETVNVRVAGLVLSQVDIKGMQRYGYGDYGHYGKNYYHD